MIDIVLRMTEREFDTLLAALRHWQTNHAPELAGEEVETDEDAFFYRHDPLTVEELDEFCERINTTDTNEEQAHLIRMARWAKHGEIARRQYDTGLTPELAMLTALREEWFAVDSAIDALRQPPGPVGDITAPISAARVPQPDYGVFCRLRDRRGRIERAIADFVAERGRNRQPTFLVGARQPTADALFRPTPHRS